MTRMTEALRQAERDGTGSHLLNQAAVSSRTDGEPRTAGFDLSRTPKLNVNAGVGSSLVPFRANDALAAEKFGLLAAKLSNLRAEHGLKSLLITSSALNEGKTFVAANLAITLAMQTGSRVLLLEGDLRRPAIGKSLGVGPLVGIGEWASTQQPIQNYLYQMGDYSMWMLPAGEVESPATLLQSQKLVELFPLLEQGFDWVVVDSPPVLPLADTNLWSRLADGTLLVAREGTTPRKLLRRTLEALGNSNLLGIVLNEASEKDFEYSYHPARNSQTVTKFKVVHMDSQEGEHREVAEATLKP
jgi:capsular exopolysaccharide synthesis family protein